LPLLVGELQEIAGWVARAGVVDQHVDAAKGVGEVVDHVGRVRQLCEIQPPHLALLSRGPHGLQRLLHPCLVGVVSDTYAEAVLRQLLRRLLTDTRVGRGHYRDGTHVLSFCPQDLSARLYAPGADGTNGVRSLRVEVVGIYVGAIERAEGSRSIVKAEMLARVLGITRMEMLVDAPMGEQGQKDAPSLQL
jgi:hypothetical protein